jgi:predicted transposase YbfD/YdcC
MEASPWLRRSASRCWHTLPPCRIRASVPRCCIRYRKSCFWCWPRRSPGQTTSSRRRCGEPSIWRSSDGSTATTAASPAMIRCATCSRPWTRSCSSPAFWPGSTAYETTIRTSSRLTARPRGAATTGERAATPCTSCPPGRHGSGSCSGTEEKSNEITAIPLLLKHLDLKGALVTMDAMGTQTDIARAIRDGGGDYCMSLKKNWPAVHAEVEELFTHPPDDVTFQTTETVDLTAGRIETRRHTVCHKVDWMTSDRHYPGEPVFPDLAMIGRIETEVERDGKIEHETRYYLCSIALCALSFARVVRAHWGVENRLHWVLDVIFREDLARFRTGDGPQNMAIIRHTALNLLSRAKPTTSLKNRRKRAGWNVGYLETVIRQTA